MYPLYDALRQMLTNEKLDHLMKSKLIEIVPLAYMRGRTLDKAFVILDEAQNTTINQMKMFLTRMGSNSKFIICGDTSQIDLSKNQESGLKHAIKILNSIKDIGFISFSLKDIIRHKLVKSIIEAYKKINTMGSNTIIKTDFKFKNQTNLYKGKGEMYIQSVMTF